MKSFLASMLITTFLLTSMGASLTNAQTSPQTKSSAASSVKIQTNNATSINGSGEAGSAENDRSAKNALPKLEIDFQTGKPTSKDLHSSISLEALPNSNSSPNNLQGNTGTIEATQETFNPLIDSFTINNIGVELPKPPSLETPPSLAGGLEQTEGSPISIVSETFEGSFPTGNWSVKDDNATNGSDYWDDISCQPDRTGRTAWAAASGDMTDCGTYDNNMKSWMIYGPFDLSNAQTAKVSFYYWNNSEKDYDLFKWLVSSDGSSFNGFQTSGYTNGWINQEFDISSYKGDSSVYFAFFFETDSSATMQGAYVDNITIVKYLDALPNLTKGTDGINTPTVSAGGTLSTSLYIANNGNGAAGGSTVKYYFGPIEGDTSSPYYIGSNYQPAIPANSTSTTQHSFNYTVPQGTNSGNYYLTYFIDADNNVAETNEDDNKWRWPITVENKPDLTKDSDFINLRTASPGMALSGWHKIKNDGPAIAAVGTVKYYFSPNSSSTSSTYQFASYAVPIIQGNTVFSAQIPINYTIPTNTAPGTYYLTYLLDADNTAAESNENNNQWAWDITVTNKPDLTSNGGTTINKTTFAPGENLTLNHEIKNNGGGKAVTSTVKYYLKKGSTSFDAADHIGSLYVPEINAGATYPRTFNYILPTNLSSGTYFLTYFIDAFDDVIEEDENNNKFSLEITIGAMPDLTKDTDQIYNINPKPGQSIDAEIKVKNQGVSSAGSHKIYYYFSTDPSNHSSSYKIGEDDVDALSAGSTSSLETFSYVVPTSTSPGTYYFYYWIDAENVVSESDENNNYWQVTINVSNPQLPDLTKYSDSINSSSFYPGDTVSFDLTVKNEGNSTSSGTQVYYYLRKDAEGYDNTYKIGSDNIGSISPGGTYNESFSYYLPNNLSPGTYYLSYWIDPLNSVSESSESNNMWKWSIGINSPAQTQSDLTVSNHSINTGTAKPGDTVVASVTVKNIGNTSMGQQADIYYYFDSSRSYSSAKRVGVQNIINLTSGQTQTLSFSYTLPSNLTPGSYFLHYWVDATNVISESSESNNQYYAEISVGEANRIIGIAMIGGGKYIPYIEGGNFLASIENETITTKEINESAVYAQSDSAAIVIGLENLTGNISAEVYKLNFDSNGNFQQGDKVGDAQETFWSANIAKYFNTQKTFAYSIPSDAKVGAYRIIGKIDGQEKTTKDFYILYNSKNWFTWGTRGGNYDFYVGDQKALWYTADDTQITEQSNYSLNFYNYNSKSNLNSIWGATTIFNKALKEINNDNDPKVSAEKLFKLANSNRFWSEEGCNLAKANGFNPDTLACLSYKGVRLNEKNQVIFGPGYASQCQDYSHLMLDLMRAVEIPAKITSGLWYWHPTGKTNKPGDIATWNFHQWVEAFNPSKEWLVYDATPNIYPTGTTAGIMKGTRLEYGRDKITGFIKGFEAIAGIYSSEPAWFSNRVELSKKYKPDANYISLSLQTSGGQTSGINFEIENTAEIQIKGKDDPNNTGSKFLIEIIPIKANRPVKNKITTITSGIDIAPAGKQQFNQSLSLQNSEYDEIIVLLKEYIDATRSDNITLASTNASGGAMGVLNESLSPGISSSGIEREVQGTAGKLYVQESTVIDSQKSYSQEHILLSNQETNNGYEHSFVIDTGSSTVLVPGYSNLSSITNPNIHYLTLEGAGDKTTYLFTKKPALLTLQGSTLTLKWNFSLTPYAEQELSIYREQKTTSEMAATLYSALSQNIIANGDPITFVEINLNTNYKTTDNVAATVKVESAAATSLSNTAEIKISTAPAPGVSAMESQTKFTDSATLNIAAGGDAQQTFNYSNHGEISEGRYYADSNFLNSKSKSSFNVESAYEVILSAPATIDENQNLVLTADVKNKWAGAISDIDLSFSHPNFSSTLNNQKISLNAGETKQVKWTLTPTDYGSFNIPLTVTAPSGGTKYLTKSVQVLGLSDLKPYLEAANEVAVNASTPIKVTVYNAGDYNAVNIPVEIKLPTELVSQETAKQIVTINAHSEKEIVWNLSSLTPKSWGYYIEIDKGGSNEQNLYGNLIVRTSGHKGDLVINNNGNDVYGAGGAGGAASEEVDHKNPVVFNIALQNEGGDDTFSLNYYASTKSSAVLKDDQNQVITANPALIPLTASQNKNIKLELTPAQDNSGTDQAFLNIQSQKDPLVVESVKAEVVRKGIILNPSSIQKTLYDKVHNYSFPLEVKSNRFSGAITVQYDTNTFTSSKNSFSLTSDGVENLTISLNPTVQNNVNQSIKFFSGTTLMAELGIVIIFQDTGPLPPTNLAATPDHEKKEIKLTWQTNSLGGGSGSGGSGGTGGQSSVDTTQVSPNFPTSDQQLEYPHVANELLLGIRKDITAENMERLDSLHAERLHQVEEILRFEDSFVRKVTINVEDDLRETLNYFKELPGVIYAEPNYLLEADKTPSDTQFTNQWGLHNTGQSSGTIDMDIDGPEAWDIETGENANIIVAVIDSGIESSHEDLSGALWTNPNEIAGNGIDDDNNGFIDDIHGYDMATCANFNESTGVCNQTKPRDNDPDDINGHGTHVSGIIAATANNNKGVAGTSWGAKLMPLRFISNKFGETADAIEGIKYAMNNGAKIINNSWGGGAYNQTLDNLIKTTETKGILFVAAAGNGGTDNIGDNNDVYPHYPSSYGSDNIISVASIDRNGNLAASSNYGLNSVDLAAPGVSILSTIRGNGYGLMSGTSMATPFVSGAAALMWARNPSASYIDIKRHLLDESEPITALTNKVKSGGLLNANKALSKLDQFSHFAIYRSTLPITAVTGVNMLSVSTATNYTDTTPVYNTDYYYAVTAVNKSGKESQPLTLQTAVRVISPPEKPTNLAQEDRSQAAIGFKEIIKEKRPVLKFHLEDKGKPALKLGYTIQIDKDGIYNSGVTQDEGDILNYTYTQRDLVNPGSYSFTPPSDLEAGRYYWRVRAENAESRKSAWETANSGEVGFSITDGPIFTEQNGIPGAVNAYYKVSDQGVLGGADMIALSEDAKYFAQQNHYLEFDYRIPQNAKLVLILQAAQGHIYFLAGTKNQITRIAPAGVINFIQDDKWHHAKIDIYEVIGKRDDLELKYLLIEDIEGSPTNKYDYYLANFSSNIQNLNPKPKQGDHLVSYEMSEQNQIPAAISDYYQIENQGVLRSDIAVLSSAAQYFPQNNPLLEFDYQLPPDAKINLGLVTTDDRVFILKGNTDNQSRIAEAGSINFTKDSTWHHAKINIYEIIGKQNIEIKQLWVEDFESDANIKYKFAFANFSSHINNFQPKDGQGDYFVRFVHGQQNSPAGNIESYQRVSNNGTMRSDLVTLSNNAQYFPQNDNFIEFDYQLPQNSEINLGILSKDGWIYLISGHPDQKTRIPARGSINFVKDGNWHHAKINIYEMIGRVNKEIQTIWLEDFESVVTTKYDFNITNISANIKNVDLKAGQGDFSIATILKEQADPAGNLSSYYKIDNQGSMVGDALWISQNAQLFPQNDPFLEFDYKIPSKARVNMGLLTTTGAIYLMAGVPEASPRFPAIGVINFVQDDSWHHAKINIKDLTKTSGEIKYIWLEDYESLATDTYSFSLANISTTINNLLLTNKQGDFTSTLLLKEQNEAAGPITNYYQVNNLGELSNDMIWISDNAQMQTSSNLEFDYKMPSTAKLTIGILTNTNAIHMFAATPDVTTRIKPSAVINMIPDDNWYHAKINLLEILGNTEVKDIWIEDFSSGANAVYSFFLSNFSSNIKNLNPKAKQGDMQVELKTNP